jgi:Fe-Mn family superoxide dismutase
MAFELPRLPYAYDALNPYMSAETLEYHHDKHHNAYAVKTAELIDGTGYENASLEEIMVWSYKNHHGLFNQAAQYYNHIHFWKWMTPNGGGTSLPGSLQQRVDQDLGGFDQFRQDFINKGATHFGSGWVWLAMDANGTFEVFSTLNGENPVVYGKTPLLGCDVWEHSYYIDYRNAKPKYLEAFFDNLVNWDYVEELYNQGPLQVAA